MAVTMGLGIFHAFGVQVGLWGPLSEFPYRHTILQFGLFFVVGPLKAEQGRPISESTPVYKAAKKHAPCPNSKKINTPPPKHQRSKHALSPARPNSKTHALSTARPNSKKSTPPHPPKQQNKKNTPPPRPAMHLFIFGRGVFFFCRLGVGHARAQTAKIKNATAQTEKTTPEQSKQQKIPDNKRIHTLHNRVLVCIWIYFAAPCSWKLPCSQSIELHFVASSVVVDLTHVDSGFVWFSARVYGLGFLIECTYQVSDLGTISSSPTIRI